MAWAVRVRTKPGGKWKRVRTRKHLNGRWATKAGAAGVAKTLRDRGRPAHAYKIPVHVMTLGEMALKEAESLVGIMEQGANNSGTKVLAIIREAGGTGPEAWCGDTVAVCYKRAGSAVVSRSWAAVRLLGFLTGMTILSDKRDGLAGEILCYTFDHTGLLVNYCDADGKKCKPGKATHLKAIEGNTGSIGAVSDSSTGGDGVYVKIRDLSLLDRVVRVTR